MLVTRLEHMPWRLEWFLTIEPLIVLFHFKSTMCGSARKTIGYDRCNNDAVSWILLYLLDNEIKGSSHFSAFCCNYLAPCMKGQRNPSPCVTNPTSDVKSIMPHHPYNRGNEYLPGSHMIA